MRKIMTMTRTFAEQAAVNVALPMSREDDGRDQNRSLLFEFFSGFASMAAAHAASRGTLCALLNEKHIRLSARRFCARSSSNNTVPGILWCRMAAYLVSDGR